MKSIKRVLGTSCAVFLVGCLVPGLVFSATIKDVKRWKKEKAVESLISTLGDENSDVRENAAWALGEIGDVRAVEPLIKALGYWYYGVQKNAAEALGKIGDARAVEPLIRALGDHDFDVQKYAAWALGRIGDARAVEPLIRVLDDFYVSKNAAEALGRIGVPAVEPLIRALGDSNYGVQWNAAEVLGKIGDDRAVESLIRVLGDKDSDVQKYVAEALGKIGDTRAIEPLIRVLGDYEHEVRKNAAIALGKMGDAHAVEQLIRMLKYDYYRSAAESWSVRRNAAEALGKIGLPAVMPLIRAAAIEFPLILKWSIVPISLSLATMIAFYVFIKGKKQIRYAGIFPAFIFWFSCFFFVCVAIRFLIGGVSLGLCYIVAVVPFFYNIPCAILLSAVSGKWLRAKRQARRFVCSRDYHRRFVIGPGLPWIVRWSKRILFIEYHKLHNDFEDYFVCKTCGESDKRLTNINKIVGLIGGDIQDFRQDGELLYINLWNEAEKKATNADIDLLEIQESNGISYDYAVNAVLNVLKNDVSRPRDYVKGIPVIIKGNPSLSENSQMILQHEFGGIR